MNAISFLDDESSSEGQAKKQRDVGEHECSESIHDVSCKLLIETNGSTKNMSQYLSVPYISTDPYDPIAVSTLQGSGCMRIGLTGDGNLMCRQAESHKVKWLIRDFGIRKPRYLILVAVKQ